MYPIRRNKMYLHVSTSASSTCSQKLRIFHHVHMYHVVAQLYRFRVCAGVLFNYTHCHTLDRYRCEHMLHDRVASPQGPRLTPQSFAGWTKVISKTTSLKRKVHVSLVCVCCDCRFPTTPPPYLGSYVLVLKPYVPSYDFSYGCRTQHMHISFV